MALAIKETILNATRDAISDFLRYRRQEDGDLPVGRIDEALRDNEIQVGDIVNLWDAELRRVRDNARAKERAELEAHRRAP